MFDVFYFGKKPHLFSHEVQVQSVDEARELSKTRFFWIVNYLSDYSGFDFLWEPVSWESQYTHAWPSQWQKDGGTYLVPKNKTEGIKYQHIIVPRKLVDSARWENSSENVFKDFDYTWHPDPAEPPYIYQFGTQHQKTGGPRYVMKGAAETKFVQNISANIKSSYATKIYFIDHYDGNIDRSIDSVTNDGIEIVKTRYSSNYLNTLRRLAKRAVDEHEYIWVCSSVCDYTNFDFSWHPEQWQSNMIHVFASNEQKFGDTFFIHVPSLLNQLDIELLEWHNINFNTDISVPRWDYFEINHQSDSHVDIIKTQNSLPPLTIFSCGKTLNKEQIPTVPLWDEKKKTITPLTSGGSSVLVPRESIAAIDTQLYDYPYIDKRFTNIAKDLPLDIIFISNGESNAEDNWKHLLVVTADKPNRVARVDGINGRVAAYQAALKESTTDWAFCVFAKLKVDSEFDWGWQPDRMQQRKHYIFHAKNPVNSLEYGHMAMIAYNKKLVMQNAGGGLDFTLEQEHDVAPLLSGTAQFNNDPWMTWRTAFRECLKLRDSLPDIENEYRLETWQTVTDGKNGEWSVCGAEDAVKYYESVNGDFEKLKLSYEWEWLWEFFNSKYSQ